MGKTYLHVEKAKYEKGDKMSENLKGHFDNVNYKRPKHQKKKNSKNILRVTDLDDEDLEDISSIGNELGDDKYSYGIIV